MKKIALLVLAFCFIISTSHAVEIKSMNHKEMCDEIKSNTGKKKYLYFFTSWCYECNESLKELLKKDDDKDYITYIISLDFHINDLNLFAEENKKYNKNIYFFKEKNLIGEFFNMCNIEYDDSIPYHVIFDENNIATALNKE
ncbi:MAG: thioredoxin-related protein [Candidatus Midichloriaceae bacterium]|jgi:thioredoxin-related protein